MFRRRGLAHQQRNRPAVDRSGEYPLTLMVVVLGMLALLVFSGCFVGQISTTMMTLPFFMPLAQAQESTWCGRTSCSPRWQPDWPRMTPHDFLSARLAPTRRFSIATRGPQ